MDVNRTPRARDHTFSAADASQADLMDAEDGQQEPSLTKFIWGTTIEIQQTQNDFRNFLLGFKIKYRTRYNAEQSRAAVEAGLVAPPSMALYDGVSGPKGEMALYEGYLSQMRQTGQANLNVDMLNLLAYPPSKRLYTQLCNYPQEVVPIMDQVLGDVLFGQAMDELDDAKGAYAEGRLSELELRQMEEEVKEMESRVYKCRPFGGERTVNMRDLNPGGKLPRAMCKS